jgi:uncharacterized protein YbjT (DUF2867 family)
MNQKQNETILVTGATGNTGGATTRHLLSAGWQVRALTRDENKPAAQALAEAGAELVQGEFEDVAILQTAMQGAYGVFSVQLPLDLALEVKHGIRIADLAKQTGVQHLVYSSVGGAERETSIPHFESKRRIEEHIESLDIPYTILRPAFFMENFYWRKNDLLDGIFKSIGLDAHKPLQMIAADDIGAFARIAFEDPGMYLGKAIEIAGDELTEMQMAEELGQSLSRSIDVVPDEDPPMFPDVAMMNAWFNSDGFEADIPALREIYPQLATLKGWLNRNDLFA